MPFERVIVTCSISISCHSPFSFWLFIYKGDISDFHYFTCTCFLNEHICACTVRVLGVVASHLCTCVYCLCRAYGTCTCSYTTLTVVWMTEHVVFDFSEKRKMFWIQVQHFYWVKNQWYFFYYCTYGHVLNIHVYVCRSSHSQYYCWAFYQLHLSERCHLHVLYLTCWTGLACLTNVPCAFELFSYQWSVNVVLVQSNSMYCIGTHSYLHVTINEDHE